MSTPHRLTPQRKAILEELRKTTSHPTAEEVFAMVRKRLPSISLGTIYRNLDSLHSQGLVQKLDKIGPQMRFDAHTAPHLHLRCVQCGGVADIPADAASVVLHVPDDRPYEVQGHWLELFGLCTRCTPPQRLKSTRKTADR